MLGRIEYAPKHVPSNNKKAQAVMSGLSSYLY